MRVHTARCSGAGNGSLLRRRRVVEPAAARGACADVSDAVPGDVRRGRFNAVEASMGDFAGERSRARAQRRTSVSVPTVADPSPLSNMSSSNEKSKLPPSLMLGLVLGCGVEASPAACGAGREDEGGIGEFD